VEEYRIKSAGLQQETPTSTNEVIKRFDVEGRFSDAIGFDNLVFISGQLGEGKDIREQTINALAAVDAALSKAKSSKDRILECTIWLKDIERDYSEMNKVYDDWIAKDKPPTRACIEAKLYDPKYLIEIRVIATKSNGFEGL